MISDIVLVALIASTAPTLTAAGAVAVSWRKERAKLDEIHVLVNSQLTTDLTKRLDGALSVIEQLRAATSKAETLAIAHEVATTLIPGEPAPQPDPPPGTPLQPRSAP